MNRGVSIVANRDLGNILIDSNPESKNRIVRSPWRSIRLLTICRLEAGDLRYHILLGVGFDKGIVERRSSNSEVIAENS